jgi:molecular chaperone GrpE
MSKKETNKANNEETILNQEQDVKKTEAQVSGQDTNAADEALLMQAKMAALEAEVTRLAKELETEKDQFVRKLADMDNYRKRLVREKDNAVLFANERLINDLIPILDDFDRAVAAATPGVDLTSYVEGVKLIQAQLMGMLDKNWGLKVMENPVGKEFSPHDHEACMLEQGEQFEHDTVLAELQKGYYLHDRVLRTAKVKVGKPL